MINLSRFRIGLYSRIEALKKRFTLFNGENNSSTENRTSRTDINPMSKTLDDATTDEDVPFSQKNPEAEVSGVDYLLSMAGMFSSEAGKLERTDQEDIANAIHRRNRKPQ